MFQLFNRLVAPLAVCALSATIHWAGTARAADPVPVQPSTVTVSYPTESGPASYSGNRGYTGLFPTNLGGAPNIGVFNDYNVFSFRDRVQDTGVHPNVIGPNETTISHALYKVTSSGQFNNDGEYFPGITKDGDITISITDQKFDRPVNVARNTFLLHALWDEAQFTQLEHPYHHGHNAHTAVDPFRDFDEFFSPYAAFADLPESNYTLGTIAPIITGEGTDTLNVSVTFPYHMLMHLEEEMMHAPPAGLPAPHGFLEPYHIHIEYAVYPVPEPSALALVALGALAVARRRRRV